MTATSDVERPAGASDPLDIEGAAARDARRALVLAVIVAALLAIVYLTPVRELFQRSGIEAARDWIDAAGATAAALFVPIVGVLVAIGVPRIFLAAVAGAAFGFAIGVTLAWVATILGCVLAFEGARALGRGFVTRKLRGRHERLEAALSLLGEHGIAGNLLLRAAPVGNSMATNLLMAISPISRSDYVLGTALGVLPETVIYSLYGSSARGHFAAHVASATLLLLALAACSYLAIRRSRLARRMAGGPDAPPHESRVPEESP